MRRNHQFALNSRRRNKHLHLCPHPIPNQWIGIILSKDVQFLLHPQDSQAKDLYPLPNPPNPTSLIELLLVTRPKIDTANPLHFLHLLLKTINKVSEVVIMVKIIGNSSSIGHHHRIFHNSG